MGEGTPVVLKMKLDCLRCESEVKKALKGFPGVKAVDTDFKNNKVTVWGNADPCKIRKRINEKTGKDVEIVSPANPPEKHVRIKEKTEKYVEIVSPANPPEKHVRIKEKTEKYMEIVSPANPPKKRGENEAKGVKGEGGRGRKDGIAPVVKKPIKGTPEAGSGKKVDPVYTANPRKNSSSSKSDHPIININKCNVIININNNKNDGEVGNDRKTGAYFSKDNDTRKPKKPVAAVAGPLHRTPIEGDEESRRRRASRRVASLPW